MIQIVTMMMVTTIQTNLRTKGEDEGENHVEKEGNLGEREENRVEKEGNLGEREENKL